jgi:N-dimethylarginine dimethylaminohydrolase
MIPIKIHDETAPLEAVILGIADDMGGVPDVDHTYDPKSREHVLDGTFTKEEDALRELKAFQEVFEKYGVEVHRPQNLPDLNQVFARDVGIVIEETLIVPHIFIDRRQEVQGIEPILEKVEADHVLRPDVTIRMEGGDVMPWKGHLFIGYSKDEDFQKYKVARTNEQGVTFLRETFPHITVKAFELNKSDIDARENALHLDCCFQPVGHDKAILHPEGFKDPADVEYILDFFGRDNIHLIDKEEMYEMHSNIFSISPEVVVSERGFKRLNRQLQTWGITVEAIPYHEISKMEGLLRCSTLPLRRRYD